jgi:hypothetical protein
MRWYGEYDFQLPQRNDTAGHSPVRLMRRTMPGNCRMNWIGDSILKTGTSCWRFPEQIPEFKKKEVRYKSSSSTKRQKTNLKNISTLSPIRKIDQEACEKFISNLGLINKYHKKRKKNLSDSSRHQYLRLLKTIFKKAVKWGYIDKNPFEDISLRTPARKAWYYIQPQDFKTILNNLDTLPTFKRGGEIGEIRKIRLKAFFILSCMVWIKIR